MGKNDRDPEMEKMLRDLAKKERVKYPPEMEERRREEFEKEIGFFNRTGLTRGCFQRFLVLMLLIVLVIVLLWMNSMGVFAPIVVLFL